MRVWFRYQGGKTEKHEDVHFYNDKPDETITFQDGTKFRLTYAEHIPHTNSLCIYDEIAQKDYASMLAEHEAKSIEDALEQVKSEFPDLDDYTNEILTAAKVLSPTGGESDVDYLRRLYDAGKTLKLETMQDLVEKKQALESQMWVDQTKKLFKAFTAGQQAAQAKIAQEQLKVATDQYVTATNTLYKPTSQWQEKWSGFTAGVPGDVVEAEPPKEPVIAEVEGPKLRLIKLPKKGS